MQANDLFFYKSRRLDLEALMLFPEEEDLQWNYLRTHLATRAIAKAESVAEAIAPLPAAMMRGRSAKSAAGQIDDGDWGAPKEMLRDRAILIGNLSSPPFDPEPSTQKASLEGQLAGLCLVLANALSCMDLATAKGQSARPSLNIVAFTIEQYYRRDYGARRGRPRARELRLPANDAQQVKEIWRKFRSVAPLWAAYFRACTGLKIWPLNSNFLAEMCWDRFSEDAVGYEQVRRNFFAGRLVEEHPAHRLFAASLDPRQLGPEAQYWVDLLHESVPKYTVVK